MESPLHVLIAAMPELTDPDWPQVPVASQSDSGANIIDQTNWDAAVFANDYAIHAQLTDRLNKNQNALVEFMSGAPAGRNDEYTLTPTSGVDPTSSAFHDHSVSTYENEGEIDFPVLAVPLGAIQNGTTNIDYVTTNFGAPSSTSTGAGVLANDLVFMPDLPDTTSSSRLRFALLLCYPDTAAKGATTCQVQAHWGGGSGTARSSSPATQLGSTDYYYHILGGSGGRIDFGGGTLNQLRLTVTDGKGDISGDEARWVGYTWYFDKDA